MPEAGWTDGTAVPPADGQEAETLSPGPGTQPEPAPGEGNGNGDGDASAPAAPRKKRLRLPRESRFGAAMLLSFLVLVTVLVVNKWRTGARPKDLAAAGQGKVPPVARIVSSTPPGPAAVAGGDVAKGTHAPAARPDAPPASVSPPPAPPVATAEAPKPAAAVPPSLDPADDGHKGEHVTLTVARNEMVPNLGPDPDPIPLPALPKDAPKTPPTPVPTPSMAPGAKPRPGAPEQPPVPVPPVTGATPNTPAPSHPVLPIPVPVPLPGSPAAAPPPPSPVELPPAKPAPAAGAGAPGPAHGPTPPGSTPGPTPTPPPAPAQPAPSPPGNVAPPTKPAEPAPAPKPPAPTPSPAPKASAPPPLAALNPPAAPPGVSLPAAAVIAPLGAATAIGAAVAHSADKDKDKDKKPAAPKPEPAPAAPKPEPAPPPVTPIQPPVTPVQPPVTPIQPPVTPAPPAHPIDIPNLDPAPAPDLASPAVIPSSTPAPLEAPAAAAAKPGDGKPALPNEMATGNWTPLPNAGKGRTHVDDGRSAIEPAPARPEPEPEPVVPARSDAGAAVAAGAGAGAGIPLSNRSSRATDVVAAEAASDAEARDRVESVPHIVQYGENFWTISQLYYGSGRFYKALGAANNRNGLEEMKKLHVGDTIRIPPPEALDRRLIEPPRARTTAAAPARQASARPADAQNPGEVEVTLPSSNPSGRRRSEQPRPDGDEPVVGPAVRVERPRYRVHARETLRSIARDTLGDSHRAGEILDLNADAIDDPNHLTPGQILELPADAQVGASSAERRGR